MNINLKIFLIPTIAVILGVLGYVVLLENESDVKIISEYQIYNNYTISVGTINDNPSEIISRTQPFADYLATKLGNDQNSGKIIVVKRVEEMDDMLKEQKLDLYFDSPVIGCMESKKTGAIPFLVRWKENVEKYHTVFVVRKDSSINAIDDNMLGKTIAFEGVESTSGYLIPKSYILKKGYELSQNKDEESIRYVFSLNDYTTAYWVSVGKADVGALSNIDFEESGDLKNELKIIERTYDIPRQIILHRSDMDADTVEKIKNILLSMNNDPQGIHALKIFKDTKKFSELAEKESFCNDLLNKLE